MVIVESFNAQIWVGLRVGYTDKLHTLDDVREICDRYVNDVKYCVTITPTEFRYVDGNEPGVIVGLVNYPRFPISVPGLVTRATELAGYLMDELEQFRVTVTTPNKSYMLESAKDD
jgi:hypothetical protein